MHRHHRAFRGLLTLLLVAAASGPVWSQPPAKTRARQAPPARPAPAAPAPPAAPAAVPPSSDAGYHYDPAGRRDPFVSLVGHAADPHADKHVDGLPGITAADLRVSGILESRGEYVAMVQGPDGKTWIAHVNDHLRDGTIKSISLREIVIEQVIRDPLAPVRQREIRKPVGRVTKMDGGER